MLEEYQQQLKSMIPIFHYHFFFFLSSNNAISSVKQASENYRLNYAFVLLMLHKEGGFAFLSKWPLSKTEV